MRMANFHQETGSLQLGALKASIGSMAPGSLSPGVGVWNEETGGNACKQ